MSGGWGWAGVGGWVGENELMDCKGELFPSVFTTLVRQYITLIDYFETFECLSIFFLTFFKENKKCVLKS